ncbi:NAD(P)-dependent alcohol dehydrogenase [Salinigranum marinum]|uniref:NAD(P)-dependent alcohol dehydrogenase n=1 Tax=Salinigranum marinum TaxID=1515595 RepID=UPI00298A02D3|nr:NAD(P)-dependent alcohol dehydrogenase [Salinigranum marinum]
MQIQAAVVEEEGGAFEIQTLELDEEPRSDEVLVRVVSAGVCHTDLSTAENFYGTPFPMVLGHEGAGVVEAVGDDVTDVEVGDHVAMSYDFCGECRNCLSGRIPYCENLYEHNFLGGRTEDGSSPLSRDGERINGVYFSQSSWATHSIANERNVVKVDPEIPLEIVGPLGCGIQTGAGAVMNALEPEAGSSVAVFGVGSVGISSVMAAAHVTGCTDVIAVDLNDDRLAKAAELGATHTINPEEEEPVDAIHEITGGGADYSLETTAVPEVLRQAVECTRIPGECGLIGAAPAGTEVSLDMHTFHFGHKLRGIIEGDAVPELFIPTLLDLWQQGRFPFDEIVTKYEFGELHEAIEDAEEGTTIKPVLQMDSP